MQLDVAHLIQIYSRNLRLYVCTTGILHDILFSHVCTHRILDKYYVRITYRNV